jgi:ribosomal protein S18 acetylase RimI-like enzyme
MESGWAVKIEEITSVDPELVEALLGLIAQLSPSAAPPTDADIQEVVDSPATRLLVARGGDGAVIGSLTLVQFRIPTGVGVWIEDVVVDEAARGQGTGEALVREAVRLAEAAGARAVNLTSRPYRVAANRLYQRLGFEQRETNVYRLELP